VLGATSSPTAVSLLLTDADLLIVKRIFFNKALRRVLSEVVPMARWERDQSADSTIYGEIQKSYKIFVPYITIEAYWDAVLFSSKGIL
jgi:hypothetical protein